MSGLRSLVLANSARQLSLSQLRRSLLGRWIPSRSRAERRLRELFDKIGSYEVVPGRTYFEKELLRYRQYSKTVEALKAEGMQEGWACGLGIYLETLGSKAELVKSVVDKARRLWTDDVAMFDFFKELSSIAKWGGTFISDKWHLLVNIELLGGYQAPLSFEEMNDAAKAWLGSTQRDYGTEGHEKEWQDEFREQCKLAVSWITSRIKKKDLITFQEFLDSPANLGSSGTSDPPYAKVQLDDGEVKPAKHTKWATALIQPKMSSDRVLNSYIGRKIYVSVKREKGKARLVARIDNPTNNIEGYVLKAMNRGMKNIPELPLSHSAKFSLVQSEACAENLRVSGSGTPIDGDKFDHRVHKQQNYKVLYEELMDGLISVTVGQAKYDLIKIKEVMLASFADGRGRVIVRKGRRSAVWDWVSGFDSGSKLTAALEQLLLAAHAATVRAMSKRLMGVIIKVRSEWNQGDDYSSVASSVFESALYCELWNMSGLTINPLKNFIGARETGGARTEFLRKTITPGGAMGYPARVVSSIVWRSPLVNQAYGEDAVRGTIDLWTTAMGRDCDVAACTRMMWRDVSAQTGWSRVTFETLAATPSAFGGLGLHDLFGYVSNGLAFNAKPVPPDWTITTTLSGLAVENSRLAVLPDGIEAISEEKKWFRDRIMPKQHRPQYKYELRRITIPISPAQLKPRLRDKVRVDAARYGRDERPYVLRPNRSIHDRIPTVEALLVDLWVRKRNWGELETYFSRSIDPMRLLSNSDRTLQVDLYLQRAPSYSVLKVGTAGLISAAYASMAVGLHRRVRAKWTYDAYRHWCFSVSQLARAMISQNPRVWGP